MRPPSKTSCVKSQVGALTHEEAAPIAQAARLPRIHAGISVHRLPEGRHGVSHAALGARRGSIPENLAGLARDYAGKSISTDEFEKLAEKVSNQELTYFFAQWVSSTGVPQFKRTWAVYRIEKGYQVVGKVQQDLDIFRMPVEIRVFPEGRKPVNERVEMVGTTADFT